MLGVDNVMSCKLGAGQERAGGLDWGWDVGWDEMVWHGTAWCDRIGSWMCCYGLR